MCFESKKTDVSNATSQQSGTSNTTGNLYPQVQPFVSQFLQQFNPGNVASTGNNPVETGAISGNQGLSGTLQPGYGTATQISQQGLTPADITPFMSPYISSVVNPTLTAQDIQNKQALSNLRGNQAAQHSLGNETGSEAAYLASVQPQQEATIASLYNTGYGQAGNLAAQSKGIQLGGLGQLGGLTNVGAGVNTGTFNMGQTQLMNPYTVSNLAASGLGGLSGIAGSNTQSTGTSTGTGTSTTTNSPSGFQDAKNVISAGSALLGLFAKGGSVHGKADGGPVMTPLHHSDDMVTKVGKAFTALHKMRKHAENGGEIDKDKAGKQAYDEAMAQANKVWPPTIIPPHDNTSSSIAMRPRRFDIGGDVGNMGLGGGWDATVSGPSFSDQIGNFGKDLGKVGGAMGDDPHDSGGNGQSPGQSDPLGPFMRTMEARNEMFKRGYDGGGTVDDSPSWGSRAMHAMGDYFSVPASVMTGLEGYPAALERIKANPEGVAGGLMRGVENAIPFAPAFEAMNEAPRLMRGLMAPRESMAMAPSSGAPDVGPPAPDTDMGMAPFQAPVGPAAEDVPQVSAQNEPSSIASAREVLPWKLGAGDRAYPIDRGIPPEPPSTWDKIKGYLPNAPMSDGIWAGQQMTPWQRKMAALTQIGDSEGVGKAMMEQDAGRRAQTELGMAQELQPSRVSLLASEAKSKAQDASLEYQIKAATAMGDLKRVQELQRAKTLQDFADQNGIGPQGAAAMISRPSDPNAFLGEDGYWYRPDPSNPGRYIKGTPRTSSTEQP